VYVDATAVEASDKGAASEVVRTLRGALQAFEHRLRRIQVDLHAHDGGHVCRLHVWAERGHTLVLESRATSRPEALAMVTASLTRALARRWPQQKRWSAPSQRHGLPPGASRRETGVHRHASDLAPALPSTGKAPRVLLALHALEASTASLHWARVLAAAFDGALEVCRVVQGLSATSALRPGPNWLDATRRQLAAARETRRWCGAVLPDAELYERVLPDDDDSINEAARLARQRDVEWVVMPAGHDGCGASAVGLARAAGCPVFVARAPTTRRTLLVATNGAVDSYPLLDEAARFAEALHAPVLAFHDVGATPNDCLSQVHALTEPWARIQSERYAASGGQRIPELDVLLAHGSDRVETILQQARREDAELILAPVTARRSPQADALAAALADRALRSVLLVPCPDDADADGVSRPRQAGRGRGGRTSAGPSGAERGRRERTRGLFEPARVQPRRWREG